MSAPTKKKYGLIMPLHNATRYLGTVLDDLRELGEEWEVVLVDDGSTDGSSDMAAELLPRASLLRNARAAGPASARNLGVAHCSAEIVVFVDADVEAPREALVGIAAFLEEHSEFAAVFGAYDDRPAVPSRVSRFRNLLHHYVHCASEGRVPSFWSGFGAIRKAVFESVGGFDQKRYPRPSVEDIDLGARLNQAGYHIYLEPRFQVKHLKKWTLREFINTDVFNRARPWAHMILEGRAPRTPLNLGGRFRYPIFLLIGGLLATLGWCGSLLPHWIPLSVWTVYLSLNFPIYQYMIARGIGPVSILLLALHHLCAAVGGTLAAWDVLRDRYLR